MWLYNLQPAASRWGHLAVQDGVINRDEFNYAMFKTLNQSNIFVEKVRSWRCFSSRNGLSALGAINSSTQSLQI